MASSKKLNQNVNRKRPFFEKNISLDVFFMHAKGVKYLLTDKNHSQIAELPLSIHFT